MWRGLPRPYILSPDNRIHGFYWRHHNREKFMESVEKKMIKKARATYKKIFPCPHRGRLEECITRDATHIYFWFNTEDQSTHLMVEKVK
jgi:hypothetical protein